MIPDIISILETPFERLLHGGTIAPPTDLLLPESDVVDYYMNNPPYYDEPKIYGFSSLLKKSSSIDQYSQSIAPEISIGFAGGASLDKNRALWKVIGESVERFALFMNNRKGEKGSFTNLSKKNYLLDPNKIYHSTKREQIKNKRSTIIDWVNGFDLTNQDNCLIPTQLIAVPYWDSGKENIWRAPITTGAATGPNIQSAIFNGICEVIERDAFMVSWLKQLQLNKITFTLKEIEDSSDTYSELLNKTLLSIKRYKLSADFYLLPNDTELPSVMCILNDNTKIGPPITVGLDTDLSIIKTMLGALEECLQLRPWVRQLYSNRGSSRAKLSHNINSLEERALLWTKKPSLVVLNNWLSQSGKIPLSNLLIRNHKLNLKSLIETIGKHGATVYFCNLTQYVPKSVQEKELSIVKVIIPEYQPLYLIEELADFSWIRLDSAEERLTCKSLYKDDVQKYPHPML